MLVHLDASSAAETRLHLADRLARRHHAALHALFAVLPPSLDGHFAYSAGAAMEHADNHDLDGRERVHGLFERAMQHREPAAVWEESRAELPLGILCRRAWVHDLLVLGQDQTSQAGNVPRNLAASMILQSGRPVIVVPPVPGSVEPASIVLIAWKPSRESARAVTAALPVLRDAQHVHIACWHDEADNPISTPDGPGELQAQLRRHGIEAVMHVHGSPKVGIGAALLAEAERLQAGLLVMGCYGHGRAREWLLGGASRTVLEKASLPVLMVH
ncbi:MAG: universal stress protein [Rhizobacter sp.]